MTAHRLGTLDHEPLLPVRVFTVETESGTHTTDSAGLEPLLLSLPKGEWRRVRWDEELVDRRAA